MLIDGLNGGSADQSHKGWFEISRFDFDLTNLTIIANGAVVGGKPNFSPLNVTVSHEAGLADVMDVAATGGLVQGVRIEGFTGGTSPAEVYELNLADVAVTKVADGEGDGYSLSLDYGKIALVTRDQTGQPISDGAFGYDLARNVAINPFSLNLSPDNSGGPVAPAKYFLAINGVKGDSLDANHKGWFEVSNFDIDLDNPFVGIPGVVQPGKAAFSPLTLTLDGNTALAPLLTMAATGDPLQGATLVGVTEGAEQDNVYRLDLADVRVTKVNDDAEADLTFRLDYSKIELETFTQNGTGGLVPEGQFGFDLAANTDGITVPSADPGGSVAASPQPARYFMVIDGVNGGSPDKQHLGWFEISGFDLDLAKSTVVGGGTGTAAFSPLNVVLPQETGLADVMDLAATGGLVKGVRIEGFTGGVTPAEVYELTLADVGVTKVADNENGGFSLSLDYGKISLVTNGIDQTGKPTKNGEFAYDVTNHTAIAPFSLNLSPSGNQAPVANAQSISTDEDTAVAVTLSGSDADGDSLTFTVVSAPAHGTLSGTGANLTYAPAANYNGPDAFTYKVNDGQADSNIATVSLTVNPVNDADLSVTMTDGRTTVVPSTSDTYTIVVSNAGPNDVTGANVSDMLPAGVTSATWALTASNGGGSVSGPTSGSGALATTVDLPSGSSVIFSFNVEVNPLATGALVNTATISPPAGTTDPNPGNNSATDTDTLAPQADLAVTMDDGRITVAPGTSDTYTIRVTNNGPSTVTSLTLTDSIPAALLNTSFAPSVGVYNIGTGVWSGLSLASGQSVSMTLSGTIDPNASGLLTNTVTVNPPAGTTDTNLANNSVTDTDTLGTPSATADLAVAITDGTTIVVPGAIDTYTITVTNNGPDTVNSLTLIEAIPAALSSPIFAPSVGAYDVGTGVWSGLSLATGQSVSMSLSGVINPNATGTLTNIVAVAGTTDTNPANNAATDTDTVALPADLAVTITDAATTLVPGSVNTYTITVSNNGPGTISSFNLIDAIPDALLNATFGSPSAGSYDPGSGLWSGLSLASGQSVFITLSGVIGIATGTLTNTVMVSALIDPNPGNNTASDTNTLTLFSSPHPPPPPATSANMILRRGDGLYAIYDIGNNATLDAHPLAQVGSDWQFAGLGSVQAGGGTAMFLRQQNGPGATGSFEIYNISNNNVASAAPLGQLNGEVQGIGNFGSRGENDVLLRNGTAFVVADVANNQITGMAPLGTVGLNWQLGGFGNFSGNSGAYDMLLRDSNSGGLQVYDIANSQIINSAFVGAVGLDWQISGFGNFSSRPGETDMIMRNANTGGLQLYDIANNQITGTAFLGTVGLEWQFAGVAPIHGPGTSDLILRNVNTGAFEAYNIANNQITGAASLGQVGLEWQVGGFAVDPAAASMGSSGSTSQLVEAMAGFGGTSGAGESLNTAPLNADTSQQTLLTTPQHA
jgi:uncharacterized repeat protein (TIGR01451 family)